MLDLDGSPHRRRTRKALNREFTGTGQRSPFLQCTIENPVEKRRHSGKMKFHDILSGVGGRSGKVDSKGGEFDTIGGSGQSNGLEPARLRAIAAQTVGHLPRLATAEADDAANGTAGHRRQGDDRAHAPATNQRPT